MNKLVSSRSSFLVYWPVILFLFAAMIISFLFHMGILAFVLLIFLLLALVCRLWIRQAGQKIELKIMEEFDGLYPGEEGQIVFSIQNNKLIPVFRADLFFPLDREQCILPEEIRPVMEWEKPYLSELQACEDTVGVSSLESLSWYEGKTVRVTWTARKRGLYSNLGWSLRTGDGFGLGQSEQKLGREYQRDLAVFPAQVPVDVSFFMKNVWNSDTGTRGVLEDPSVIRSVRDYMPGDNIKHINWRLTARGLPLSVNVYEKILPQNAFLIFDGESFSGPDPHPEEMEEALSIIGSAAAALSERNIRCGLCLSKGDYDVKYRNTPVNAPLQDLLWALAACRPLPEETDESNKVTRQLPVFDRSFVEEESDYAGKCYYIVYDPDLADEELLERLGEGKVVVLSFIPGKAAQCFRREDIRRIRRSPGSEQAGQNARQEEDTVQSRLSTQQRDITAQGWHKTETEDKIVGGAV